MVHAVLLARLPPQEAEELVQEVFLSAWLRLPELLEPQAFPGWLCSIARNRAMDRLRGRRGEVAAERVGAQEGAGHVPGDPVALAEILGAIRALPEAYRETLLLRLVGGWTGPEIAERMGMTEGSVRVNLHRGMALLRERLGGWA